QTSHGLLNIVEQVVNHAVVAHVDAAVFDQFLGSVVGAHVETKHHGTGSNRQADVSFGDAAHARGDDVHFHFFRAQFLQRSHDGFQRTTYVSFHHHVEVGHLAFTHTGKQCIQLGGLLALLNLFTHFG